MPNEIPRWLQDVAVRVDELVGNPRTMEHFRRMLRDWKAEHDARGPKLPMDKHGYILHNPVQVLPVRRMTLPEKYATVSAIHDVICEKTRRIDPWGGSKGKFNRLKSGISYGVLRRQVKGLTDADRPRIRKLLRDVEADLRRRAQAALIDRLAGGPSRQRLSDDELARLRAYLEAPPRLSELQRDPAKRERRRKLQEILNYNDELRRTGGRDGQSPRRARQWKPPPGYVGTKTICHDVRFRKSGKNPQPSTIQRWIACAERKGEPVKIVKAPDTHENHYPEAWIVEQVGRWSPRSPGSSLPAE